MPIADIIYILALILFTFMTFVIIRNYYRKKFNNKGQRMDMLDAYEKEE